MVCVPLSALEALPVVVHVALVAQRKSVDIHPFDHILFVRFFGLRVESYSHVFPQNVDLVFRVY